MTQPADGATADRASATSPMVWTAVAPSALRFADFNDATSVFNGASGETHLLGPLPVELLRLLCLHGWRFDELSARFARLCDTPNDAGWRDRLLRMLNELAALELAEPLPAAGRAAG